jgi:hypothetical protein
LTQVDIAIVFLTTLNTLLLGASAFLIQGWARHVDENIAKIIVLALEFEKFKEIVRGHGDDLEELKSIAPDIRWIKSKLESNANQTR